jgi:hypothetical protein
MRSYWIIFISFFLFSFSVEAQDSKIPDSKYLHVKNLNAQKISHGPFKPYDVQISGDVTSGDSVLCHFFNWTIEQSYVAEYTCDNVGIIGAQAIGSQITFNLDETAPNNSLWLSESVPFSFDNKKVNSELAKKEIASSVSFTVSNDTATLEIWDHKDIDGDIVSVYVNGIIEQDDIELSGKKTIIKVPLSELSNEITIVAESEGSHPPCTVRARIVEINQEFTLDAKKNQLMKIILQRQK